MRALTYVVATITLAGFAYAENTPEQLVEIREVADAFLKAAADDDFEAFKENVSSTRLAEYEKNKAACPLAQWWESARKAVDEEGASWTFAEVRTDTEIIVELVYTRTDDAGEKAVSIFMRKEGDAWHVDAAAGAFRVE
jgi:hypothetical protein